MQKGSFYVLQRQFPVRAQAKHVPIACTSVCLFIITDATHAWFHRKVAQSFCRTSKMLNKKAVDTRFIMNTESSLKLRHAMCLVPCM